jgi:signal transduction histidine kinase
VRASCVFEHLPNALPWSSGPPTQRRVPRISASTVVNTAAAILNRISDTGGSRCCIPRRALRQHVECIALDVHRISHNLHPFALIHLGFVSALRALCREFSDQARIAVDFASDVASLEITKDAGVALYRITQECLTNVARHSGSRQALKFVFR